VDDGDITNISEVHAGCIFRARLLDIRVHLCSRCHYSCFIRSLVLLVTGVEVFSSLHSGFLRRHIASTSMWHSYEGLNFVLYCHVLVTRHRVWIGNWIYWTLITRNYKELYIGVLISLWLFLFAAQPKEFFLDGLKKLEQQSHKCVELRGDYVE
jgi:hypothetical protein